MKDEEERSRITPEEIQNMEDNMNETLPLDDTVRHGLNKYNKDGCPLSYSENNPLYTPYIGDVKKILEILWQKVKKNIM